MLYSALPFGYYVMAGHRTVKEFRGLVEMVRGRRTSDWLAQCRPSVYPQATTICLINHEMVTREIPRHHIRDWDFTSQLRKLST